MKPLNLSYELVDLFAAEYGWTVPEIRALSPQDGCRLIEAIHRRRARDMRRRLNEGVYPWLDPAPRLAIQRRLDVLAQPAAGSSSSPQKDHDHER